MTSLSITVYGCILVMEREQRSPILSMSLLIDHRTETGLISTVFRGTSKHPANCVSTFINTVGYVGADDGDWEYFEINSQINGQLLPNNDLEHSYRLVVTVGPV